MKTTLAVLALSTAMLSVPAFADGQAAANTLRASLQRSGTTDLAMLADAHPAPTLVRNMYRLNKPNGEVLGYVNEAGTIHGNARGFSIIPADGTRPRLMTPAELAQLRREVMANIAYDKLIKVGYGNGGGRKMLMFSALDCPSCRALESATQTIGNLHTTFYVLPASLQSISDGGQQKMEAVSRLWCAENNGNAWKAYWANRTVPGPANCEFDPRSAEQARADLRDILRGAGTRLDGFPALIGEDGMPVARNGDAETLRTRWGREGKPALTPLTTQWLADARRARP
jgi:hypothetical protein